MGKSKAIQRTSVSTGAGSSSEARPSSPAPGSDTPSLEAFLAGNCEATKAKYAAELEHASAAWRKPLDLRYAESLEFFGLLERLVKPVYRGERRVLCGSRIWFRKAPGCSTVLSAPRFEQTELAI